MRIGILDYGVGNLGSVYRALEELRVAPALISRAIDMHAYDCFILPGVGNFTDCANLLSDGGWTEELNEQVAVNGRPLLGICVGMQLLANFGVEGATGSVDGLTKGLGLVPGRIESLRTLGCDKRLPHVGWNGIHKTSAQEALFANIPDDTDFYFVHSYAYVPEDEADVIATVDYGIPITAAVRRGHVWGTQFHPEKSSRAGFRLLQNFINGPEC